MITFNNFEINDNMSPTVSKTVLLHNVAAYKVNVTGRVC